MFMDATNTDAQFNRADLEYLQGLPQDDRLGVLLGWLTGKQKRQSNLAIRVLAQTNKAATDQLLAEAFAKGKSPRQRILLLSAIEQVGHPLDANQLMWLMTEARRFKGAVFKQIAQLLAWNR
jgi:hypothetical protein